MNYLIIMPKVSYNEEAYNFPIGIAYVSSSLKQTERNVFTLNLNYKDMPLEYLLRREVENKKIDVIAVGGLSRQYNDIYEILKTIKNIKSSIITLVGGGIITSDPKVAMEALEFADYGMIGEGEITICELADAIEGKRDTASVDGIIYKTDGAWSITNTRKEITDLDSLPFPDYEGFEFGEMLNRASMSVQYGDNLAYIISSRSCPYHCTFCFHPSGTKYRTRSIENVFKEIDWLIDQYPQIKNFRLNDELFGMNKDFLVEFCSGMAKRNLGFSVQMRVDNISEEILILLRDSGCIGINFGLESANDSILKSMQKHITATQIENALELCNQVAVSARGNFIFGDLEETLETAMYTFNWWKQHPQFSIALSNIIVYPGSYLYEVALKKGIIEDPIEFLKDGCPQINISKMSDQEYKLLMDKINMEMTMGTNQVSDVKIEYNSMGKIDISARCPSCNKKNNWTGLPAFNLFSDITCHNCHKGLKILVSDYIDDTAEKNMQYLSQRPVAIWPMNTSVVNLAQKVPSIFNENVFIIDSSPIKQGTDFHGKKISAPNIIKEKNIETVLIANSYIVGNDIINIIQHNYINVKNIYYIDALLDIHLLEELK